RVERLRPVEGQRRDAACLLDEQHVFRGHLALPFAVRTRSASAYVCRSRGSNVSRNQSPRRFTLRITTAIVTPGVTASHHASTMYFRPSDSIEPHVAVGGTTPKPRKL